MPYSSYVNNLRTKRCPYCGVERPVDWYVPMREACWKCRETKRDESKAVKDELIR